MASTAVDHMSWSKSYGRDRRRTYKGRYERIASYNPDVSSSYASTRSTYRSAYTSPSPVRKSRRDTLDVEDYRSPSTSPSSSRYRSSVSPSGGSYRASVSPSASRLRATASVDRDIGYEVNRSYSGSSYTPRYSASVDREINHEVKQSEKYFGVRQPTYNSYSSNVEYSSQGIRPRQSYSLDRGYTRGASLDRDRDIDREVYDHTSHRLGQYRDYLSESRSNQDLGDSSYDTRSTYSAPARRTRAASVSRVGESIGDYEIVHRTRRASSVSRLDLNHEEERSGPGWEVVLGPCQARTLSTPTYSKPEPADHYSYKKSYTIEQDQNYDPDEVEVVVTPSGKKAVSYKRFSQYGRGDPKEANKAFKTVEERTKYLETQMTSLEDFVRKNRHLFPEETTIYQQVRFFQLNEEQLRQIGESPDAEVYGVKIREKLVVPPGTEIAEILNRHYGRSTDVKVEYSNKASKVQTSEETETETFAQIQERIRNKVEKEFENREKAKLLTQESYDVQQANKHIYRQEGYEHLHPHVTPQYLKSIYVNAGLTYEDHYSRGSGSDTESVRSTTSRKSKRYDTTPSFTAKLRPKRCMEGQTVRFNCSISGLPPPEVIWFKGSKIINDSSRFKITNNYGLLSLEINNVEREDAGVYSIKAINPEGEVASSAPLEVQEVAPLEERGDGTRKPWFVVEATNSWAEVGGKATLEAQAAGKPMPTFKWQKDNVTIHDSDRYRIYTDQQGNTKLVIQQSKEADTGLYFIIAENKAGVAKCAATLRIAERSMIPESERPRRSVSRETTPVRSSRRSYSRETTPAKLRERTPIVKGTKPWFLRVLQSEVQIRVGDPLTLTCVVDGDPKPKVTWLKGVRELTYDKRKRVVVHGDHHLLEVERMLETEAGQYVVVAENPLGRVSCTCWVNILPRRQEEDEDFEVRRLKLELPEYEYDTSVRGEHLMMRPRFTKKLPLEQELTAGENLEIKCKVREGEPEFIRTGVDVDVKVKKPGGITEEIITMTKHGAEVSVKEVKKRDWLETEEKTPEPAQEPESSVAPKPAKEAEKTKSPELEGEKPVFAVALADKTVKLDSIAKLSVTITARPEPKIQWSKDGNNIKDGGRYEVFEEDGMYHLEVYDVEAVDAGTYQCCASNDIGSATSSCCLTVAGGEVIQKEATEKEGQPEPAKEEPVELAKEEPTEAKPKEVSPEKQKEAESPEKPSESEKDSSVEPAAKEEIKSTEAPSIEPEKEETESQEEPAEIKTDAAAEVTVKEEAKPDEKVPSKEPLEKEESESEEESEEEEPTEESSSKDEVKEVVEEVKEKEVAEQPPVAEQSVVEDRSASEEKKSSEEEAVSEPTVETAKSPEQKTEEGEGPQKEEQIVEDKIEASNEKTVQEAPKEVTDETEQPKEEVIESKERAEVVETEKPKEEGEEKESFEEEETEKKEEEEKEESIPKETVEAKEQEPVSEQKVEVEKDLEEVKECETKQAEKTDTPEPAQEEESDKKESVDESQTVVKDDVKVEAKEEDKEDKAEKSESEGVSEEESESEEEDTKGEEKSKEETKSEPEQVVPSFAKSITNLVVPEGASAKFECEVSGIPDPEIAWTKDGSTLATGANVKVAVEGAVCTLCVESVKKDDEGEYTCSATNAAGTVSCSATLKIQETAQEPETVPASTTETEPEAPKPEDQTDDKPKEDEDSGTEDSEEDSSEPESDSGSESESESQPEADKLSNNVTTVATPVFSKPLHNIATLFGKEISLECKVSINPLIDVVWIRDGQE